MRRGDRTTEIAFPLGGIATGCVSLDGRGGLKDWEIFNRPNKGSYLDYTFPAIWIKEEGREARAAAVLGPRQKEWMGDHGDFWSYGHGRFFRQMDGLPCFDELEFTGTFPLARVKFKKYGFPVDIELAALNPFIPQDVAASSYPVAHLTYRVTNRSKLPVEICLAWSMQNPVGMGDTDPEKDLAIHEWFEGPVNGISFINQRYEANDPRAGEVVLATSWADTVHLAQWSEEGWWDSVRAVWNHFRTDGSFGEPSAKPSNQRLPGSLGLRAKLQPGESVELPFLFAWRFPNATNYWKGNTDTWQPHYATVFSSAREAAEKYVLHQEDLVDRTLAFEDALFSTSLPPEAVESISAPLSVLHSPTVIRDQDGAFWAWEGCSAKDGCCDGTCSHVWNYATAHAYLFPEIQKSFLDSAFLRGFDCGPEGEKGGMGFRIPLPLIQPTGFWHAASDGQLGQIVQAYRDWRLTGSDEWIASHWDSLKKALEYAWVQWDRDQDGLVDGDMHNTYDINFQGPNPLTQFFYLAALKAMAGMALHLGKPEGKRYSELAENGAAFTMERLFNQEYFFQEGDFTSPEAPRYQHGPGCLSDQLFGQLAASQAGLGHLVPGELVKGALASIFQNNFRIPLGDHENLQRVYAMPDEAGLLLCTWPYGGMPYYPFVYSDEVWTGIEYQVASHLAMEGFEEESLVLCKAIRDRYDGKRRNPWNEFECGSHYARALASYGVLLGLTGFRCDAVEGYLTFKDEPFRALFSIPGAWGVAERTADGTLEVEVRGGQLPEGIVCA